MDALQGIFLKLGLQLKTLDAPMGGARNKDIVQFDIRREAKGTRRSEWFVYWQGAGDALITVPCSDKSLQQLVLLVNEPKRDVTREIRRRELGDAQSQKQLKQLKLQKKNRKDSAFDVFTYVEQTAGRAICYLMGRDERQLFMCQLPKPVTSMQEAFAVLRPKKLTLAEGKFKNAPRQGEWFFVPATKAEQGRIDAELKLHMELKDANIGTLVGLTAGKPHIAARAVKIPAVNVSTEYRFSVQGRADVFVCGPIRHEDHPTRMLRKWHRVILNGETRQAARTGGRVFVGGQWFD